MKTGKILVSFIIAALVLTTACTKKVYIYKSMPPGHAKKISGSKSAKHHAPGQKKKRHHW